MGVVNFKHTKVYKLAFEQAMEIFAITKSFPKEETYSLIDQIRRSSRSVYVPTWQRPIERRYFRQILFQKLQITMQKILKPEYGLILH
jgi:hypothetical protein